MSYADLADLAQHPGFRARVRIAMITAGIAVGAETDDGSEYARLRRAHSVNLLLDQDNYGNRYAWAVASNPAISYTSSDSDIQFTVNSIFSAMAGAGTPPVP